MRGHIRSVIRLVNKHVAPNTKDIIGAEVGVWRGEMSWQLLEHLPQLRCLYMIDAWQPYKGSNMDGKGIEEMQVAKQEAIAKTHKYGNRRLILQTDSASAANGLITLDFVFIDADHTYEGVKRDLHAWWPTVRSGGLFSGHDYKDTHSRNHKFGVKTAVDEFAAEKGLEVQGPERGKVWWMIKS